MFLVKWRNDYRKQPAAPAEPYIGQHVNYCAMSRRRVDGNELFNFCLRLHGVK
jgi:hypothetical protein